ncbi:nitroreductase [Candidatus Entotheonella serta]|nr:nitroreductase [Candidatus Entotheonella serta]
MINETISLFDAMHSQRAIRHFSAQPVSDEAVETILSAAIRAPSGGNRQPWRFIVIRDADVKLRLGQWYLSAWQAATANMEVLSQAYRHGAELAQQMTTVPVLILACIDHGEAGSGLGPVTRGASIYPAVQNLMLAARALGLGTVLTTLHTQYETEIKALLNIPASVETAALIPVGYPAEGVAFGRARRKPLSDVVFHDQWR